MYFSVLGPLEVRDNASNSLRIAGGRRRTLILRLLLVPNRVVSFDRLVDDVWGQKPRRGVRSPLAAHISLLRDQLGADRIRTEATGYLLVVGPDELDAELFEKELHQAQLDSAQGNHATSVHTLTAALGRWRGDALEDARDQPWAIGSATRMDELRYSAQELLMMGRLALGDHHEVAAVATAVVSEQPLRETGWAILMLALYRSSRQAEALRAYRELVRLLGEELGIEPSSGLSALEEAIILQKPELDWSEEETRVDLVSTLLNVSSYGQLRVPPATTNISRAHDSETTQSPTPETQTPSPHKSFIGREEELLWLHQHIQKGSLVTLTGPAGVGKTRIALQAAQQLERTNGVEIYAVDLSAGRDGDVLQTISAALGIALRGHFSAEEILTGALSGRDLLLVLDGCEGLRESCASAVGTLLTNCPDLAFVATSREPLDAPGEIIYTVPPLILPSWGVASSAEELLASSPAVHLFTERAAAHTPSFRLDASTAHAVVTICNEVDGIPLALELAAAQLTRISVFDLAQRLDDQLNLLVSKDPTVSLHLRSVRNSIDRSYGTLSEEQKALLRYLSVFVGTWSLIDVERIAPALGMQRSAIDEALGELVDKSLVQIDQRHDRYRYRLLASIGQYASERLAAEGSGDRDRANQAHAEAFLRASEDLNSSDGHDEADEVDSTYPNFKLALEYLAQRPDRAPDAFRMAASLRDYWPSRVADGTALFRVLLNNSSEIPEGLLSQGFLVFGELLYMEGDQSAPAALDMGLGLAGEIGDEALRSDILSSLSAIEAFQGDDRQAMVHAEEALTAASRTGDRRLVAKAHASNGLTAVRNDRAAAYRHYSTALDLYTELEQRWGMSDCLANLGLLDLSEGATSLGMARLDEALRLAAVGRHSSLECWVTVYSGFAALYRSEAVFAEAQFDTALALARTRGLPNAAVHGMAGKGALLANEGRSERGAQLLGAAEALRRRASESWHPAEEMLLSQARARLQTDLGDAGLSLAVQRGGMLSLFDSLALALDSTLGSPDTTQ
jgi:predicted ATPase/DNA-binding SARP family transcriptional activator